MCFRFLQVMRNFLRTGELPHHDHAQVEGLDEQDNSAFALVAAPEGSK